MANRRTLFHQRKEKPRSVSKIGLLLCLLLAGGVLVVPASSDIVLRGKAKIRDLALTIPAGTTELSQGTKLAGASGCASASLS